MEVENPFSCQYKTRKEEMHIRRVIPSMAECYRESLKTDIRGEIPLESFFVASVVAKGVGKWSSICVIRLGP